MVNVREYSSSNQHIVLLCRINEAAKRMSLKSTEVENCSRIIRATLISSFRSSSNSQTSFPSDHQTNSVFVNDDFTDDIFLPNSIAPSSSRCNVLTVPKKIDHFLREIVRGKILFRWLNVNPSSFMQWYGCCCPNEHSRLRFCFCL